MNLSDNLSADVQQDRPDFVGVILTEATAPNEVQAALRAMEDRFQTAFDNAAVGMAHVALDGRWLEVNQCLCEILGYDKETLLEKTAQELTHPEDLAETQEGLRRLAAGEITVDIREKRFLRGDGQAVWTLVAASPAKDSRDGPAPLLHLHHPRHFSAQRGRTAALLAGQGGQPVDRVVGY